MNPISIQKLLQDDPRFKVEAYQFVRDALAYAHEVMKMSGASDPDEGEGTEERHLTGQQLCEAIRQFALEQYGYMAKTVLNSWGIHSTGDIGDIVYNLIGIGAMKKSANDHREDFDDVYRFENVFELQFQIRPSEKQA